MDKNDGYSIGKRVKDLRPRDYGEGAIVGYENDGEEFWCIRWDNPGLDNEWLNRFDFELIVDDYENHIQDCRDCPNCGHAECIHEENRCKERNGCECLGFIRAARVFMFTNGTVAVCDEAGNQIPEFQGTWINFDYLRELAKTIRKDRPKTEGVLRLPSVVRETLFPEAKNGQH